jgi:hypothetical protein
MRSFVTCSIAAGFACVRARVSEDSEWIEVECQTLTTTLNCDVLRYVTKEMEKLMMNVRCGKRARSNLEYRKRKATITRI